MNDSSAVVDGILGMDENLALDQPADLEVVQRMQSERIVVAKCRLPV